MKVAIVGATGQTGAVIVDALLKSTTPKFVWIFIVEEFHRIAQQR